MPEPMHRQSPDFDPTDFGQIEAIVRAAGGYVCPTDDLRPKALEAAKFASWQRRISLRLGGMALLVSLFNFTGLPEHFVPSRLGLGAIQSEELYRRAAQNVHEKGTSSHWALFEVFSEHRRNQAKRLRPGRTRPDNTNLGDTSSVN